MQNRHREVGAWYSDLAFQHLVGGGGGGGGWGDGHFIQCIVWCASKHCEMSTVSRHISKAYVKEVWPYEHVLWLV